VVKTAATVGFRFVFAFFVGIRFGAGFIRRNFAYFPGFALNQPTSLF
jgi:hypothetical protein